MCGLPYRQSTISGVPTVLGGSIFLSVWSQNSTEDDGLPKAFACSLLVSHPIPERTFESAKLLNKGIQMEKKFKVKVTIVVVVWFSDY